jgi:hypothetical protein
MHKLPNSELPKIKVNVVGPDDINEGDVDPPKHAMCHHGNWRQLYYVGSEGKGNQNFRCQKVGRKQVWELPRS